MNRRGFLAASLMGAAYGASAQVRKAPAADTRRVGFLAIRSRPATWDVDSYGGFVRGMRDLGYVEGRNLVMEWRFADGRAERLPALAGELAALKPDVIVAGGASASRAVREATSSVPIVMAVTADPQGTGFAATFIAPGAQYTEANRMPFDVSPRYLELLQAVMPKLAQAGLLLNPDNQFYSPRLKSILEAGRLAGVTINRVEATSAGEIENAFKLMRQRQEQAAIIPIDPVFIQQRHLIAASALESRIPTIFGLREHVEAGGLMSYGQSFTELYRRAAIYVDRILKGDDANQLPVEQRAPFELALNLKSANALGITFPQNLVKSAGRVIR